jgi:hypothetical protein
MAKPGHNNTLKKAMIKALEQSLGIVTTAAKMVGIERQSHYRWLEEDPKYKAAVDSIADMALDMAESSLHHQINERVPASTIFYLKTKGKRRGYIEKQEIGFTDNEGNNVNILFKPSQDEPLK